MESTETQDCVRGAMDLSQEEAEEISFGPSAISVPQKPLFRCDNRCSAKTQFLAVCVGGDKQQCYNGSLLARGDTPLSKW